MAIGLNVEREKPAVAVQRQPPAGPVIASLGGADEILAPLADPLDRPAEPPRGPQHQHIFRIEEILDPEPAADIRRDDTDALFRDVENRIGELIADAVHPLPADQEIETARCHVVFPDRGARLDRRDDQPVVDQRDFNNMRRLGKRGRNGCLVTALETVGQVARRRVP